MDSTIYPTHKPDGQTTHPAAFDRKITEHDQIEQKLQESNQRFRRLADQVFDTILVIDMEGRILDANKHACESLGYTREELLELNIADIDPEVITSEHRRRFWEKLTPEAPVVTFAGTHVRKDGTTFPVEVRLGLLTTEREKTMLGLVRDITDWKKAQEEAEKARDAYITVTNLTGDIIVQVDKEGRWTFLNDGACQFWGQPREKLLGIRFADYLHPDDVEEAKAVIQKMIETRQMVKGVTNRQKTPRGWRIVEWNGAPVFDENGNYIGMQSTGRDITEREEAQQRLYFYQQRLREMTGELSKVEERERRALAGELHDDIAQTLALCKMRLAELSKLSPSSDVASIVGEVRSLLDNAIDTTRSLIFQLSPPVLYELGFIPAVEWLVEQLEQEHGVVFRIQQNSQLPPIDDEVSIVVFRAVRELLINVIRHASTDTAIVSIDTHNDQLRVVVEDEGVGFDVAQLASSKRLTGFGLFHIRERLDYLGGHLEIESQPGTGTRVAMTVPLRLQKEATTE